MNENMNQKIIEQMKELAQNAVMSKFVSIDECKSYRRAIFDCIEIFEKNTDERIDN